MYKIMILCIVFAVSLAGCQEQVVGGDKDEHGCIGSAGYTWCEEKQKCLRTWEEPCELVGDDKDEHGCIGSAGYTWCEEKEKCLRVWEEPCAQLKITTDEMPFDDYSLETISLKENILSMKIGYTGGCESHEFELVWDGKMTRSIPPIVTFRLSHENNNDACEAYIMRDLVFDIENEQLNYETIKINFIDHDGDVHELLYVNKPIDMTMELCNGAGGNWNECSSKCQIDAQGKDGVACTLQCEQLCECAGIAGFSCPAGFTCNTPPDVADAIGYCS